MRPDSRTDTDHSDDGRHDPDIPVQRHGENPFGTPPGGYATPPEPVDEFDRPHTADPDDVAVGRASVPGDTPALDPDERAAIASTSADSDDFRSAHSVASEPADRDGLDVRPDVSHGADSYTDTYAADDDRTAGYHENATDPDGRDDALPDHDKGVGHSFHDADADADPALSSTVDGDGRGAGYHDDADRPSTVDFDGRTTGHDDHTADDVTGTDRSAGFHDATDDPDHVTGTDRTSGFHDSDDTPRAHDTETTPETTGYFSGGAPTPTPVPVDGHDHSTAGQTIPATRDEATGYHDTDTEHAYTDTDEPRHIDGHDDQDGHEAWVAAPVVATPDADNKPTHGSTADTVRADATQDDAAYADAAHDHDSTTDDATPVAEELKPGDAEIAPVPTFWAAADTDGYRDRWREAQLRFVDDPKAATDEIRGLIGEAAEAVSNALTEQRRDLDAWSAEGDGPRDTEQLRVVIQRYRTFFDRLLNL